MPQRGMFIGKVLLAYFVTQAGSDTVRAIDEAERMCKALRVRHGEPPALTPDESIAFDAFQQPRDRLACYSYLASE